MKLAWFAGVDWGSQKHQACVLDAAGNVLGEREFEHGGAGLSQMADWLMLPEKRQLADELIDGDGEVGLTELPDDELLDLVRLDVTRAAP